MGTLHGIMKYRNPDTSLDINRRLFGVMGKGVYDGDVITHPLTTQYVLPVPGQLAVSVNPFIAMGADGMLIVHEGSPTVLQVAAGQTQYVVCRSKYNTGTDPTISLEVLTAAQYTTDPDRSLTFMGQPTDALIVLAKLVVPSVLAVTNAHIDLRENHVVNSVSRPFIRGVFTDVTSLPTNPVGGPTKLLTGDVALVVSTRQFYRWNGVVWETVTDGAVSQSINLHLGVRGASPLHNVVHGGGDLTPTIPSRDAEGYPSHPALTVSVEPSAGVTAVNVQQALYDLDIGLSAVSAAKVSKSGDTMSGNLTITTTGTAFTVTASSGTAAVLSGVGTAVSVTSSAGVGVFSTGYGDGLHGTSSGTGVGVFASGATTAFGGNYGGKFLGGSGAAGNTNGAAGIMSNGGTFSGSGLGGDGIVGQGYGASIVGGYGSISHPLIGRVGIIGIGGASSGRGVVGSGGGATTDGVVGLGGGVTVVPANTGSGVVGVGSNISSFGVVGHGGNYSGDGVVGLGYGAAIVSPTGSGVVGVGRAGIGGSSGGSPTPGIDGGFGTKVFGGAGGIGGATTGGSPGATGGNGAASIYGIGGAGGAGGPDSGTGGGGSGGAGGYGVYAVGGSGGALATSPYGDGNPGAGGDGVVGVGYGAGASVPSRSGSGVIGVSKSTYADNGGTSSYGVMGVIDVDVHNNPDPNSAGVYGVATTYGAAIRATGPIIWTTGARGTYTTTSITGTPIPSFSGSSTGITWSVTEGTPVGIAHTPGSSTFTLNTGFYLVSYSLKFVVTSGTTVVTNLSTNLMLDAANVVGSNFFNILETRSALSCPISQTCLVHVTSDGQVLKVVAWSTYAGLMVGGYNYITIVQLPF